ncbi:hypothetical protein IV47_GL000001 [Lactobacillus delbrueckii subsp. bulgaricus ATCC 11842 = JCM 1002]|nr:hypothetical protein IV47_GL000001 [Lactobacillus delbrueckii subsp. bulgaricus ATCC 11842 = JCM 1002]
MKKKIEKSFIFFASRNRDNPNYLFFKKQFLRKEKNKRKSKRVCFYYNGPW